MEALRVALVGKGGAGKSLIAGTLARLLARRGRRVLVLDSDTLPGLEFSLGVRPGPVPPLMEAAERGEDGRWRLRRGIGPVRAVQRYALEAPDGIRLLQSGKTDPEEGLKPVMPAVQAFYRVVHRLRRAESLRAWDVVGDLPAGPRQAAFDWAPYADTFVLVVEPSVQSLLAAKRIARIVEMRGRADVLTVANQVRADADVRRIARSLGAAPAVVVPADAEVAAAERAGAALIDHAPRSPAVAAVERLLEALDRGRVAA